MPELAGLTWDHPRGYAPLERLARDGGRVRWSRQPLEGFESTPIDELARRYDLLVIDHPGLGAAVERGCLRPLDTLLEESELDEIRATTVGASFDSYTLDGQQWALPIDAATQVSVAHPDRLPGPSRPTTWAEVAAVARGVPTAVCLGGPHALLMFSAACVAAGEEPGGWPDRYVSRPTGLAVLDVLADIVARADPDLARANPIGALAAMAADDGPAYCPLVYGYVSYQAVLRAGPAPAWTPGGRPGSVLGGTGIAVSRHCERPRLAADEVRALTSTTAQRDVFPRSGGQPAALAAWTDPAVDEAAHGFYRDTLATMRAAWVRPRFAGFIGFQTGASATLREGLLARTAPERLLDDVDDLFRTVHKGVPR